jgi:SAM-dependent methyltransferase
MDNSTSAYIFDEIYLNNIWGNGSGPGSERKNALPYIEFVNSFMRIHRVKTVLDLGVGDGQVLASLELGNRNYVGVDVSKEAISRAESHASSENIKLVLGDIEEYSYSEFDLILCKDVLQHLPNVSVKKILSLISENSKFAIICNDVEGDINLVNSDIKLGGYRAIDIRLAPFNFNASEMLRWNSAGFTKAVFLISKAIPSPRIQALFHGINRYLKRGFHLRRTR